MKKLIICTLVGLCCFSTTAGIAQTKKETTQSKILRLEAENKVLLQQNAQLLNQIAELKASNIQRKNTGGKPATQQGNTKIKPWYKTAQIQRLCESLPFIKNFVEQKWKETGYNGYSTYQVIKASLDGEETIPDGFFRPSYKKIFFNY